MKLRDGMWARRRDGEVVQVIGQGGVFVAANRVYDADGLTMRPAVRAWELGRISPQFDLISEVEWIDKKQVEPVTGWVSVFENNSLSAIRPTHAFARDIDAGTARKAIFQITYTPGEGLD